MTPSTRGGARTQGGMRHGAMRRLAGRGMHAAAVAALAWLLVPGTPPAWAQSSGDLGGGRGRHGGGRHQARQPPVAPSPSPASRDPWPRLDAGALLCGTEAELQQHQVAVAARLDGREAPEPQGCRIVRAMTAVTVVDRHGPARAEVRLPGPPEQLGWTDAVLPDKPPSR